MSFVHDWKVKNGDTDAYIRALENNCLKLLY